MNGSSITRIEAIGQKQFERRLKRSIIGVFGYVGSVVHSMFLFFGTLLSRYVVMGARFIFFGKEDLWKLYQDSIISRKSSSDARVDSHWQSSTTTKASGLGLYCSNSVNSREPVSIESEKLNLKSLPIRLYLLDARQIQREREEKDSLKLLIRKFGEESVTQALEKIQVDRPELVSAGQVFFKLSLQKNLSVNLK